MLQVIYLKNYMHIMIDMMIDGIIKITIATAKKPLYIERCQLVDLWLDGRKFSMYLVITERKELSFICPVPSSLFWACSTTISNAIFAIFVLQIHEISDFT